MIESKRCQQTNSRVINQAPQVACVKTNPHPFETHNTILCTCDITNVYYHDCLDNSDTYYVYLHKNSQKKPPGFYFLNKCCLTGHLVLYDCSYSYAGPLWVLSTVQLYVAFSIVEYDCVEKLQARTAYENYIQDCNYWAKYGITHEGYMDKILTR